MREIEQPAEWGKIKVLTHNDKDDENADDEKTRVCLCVCVRS